MAARRSRRHHTVPRFYLSRFATRDQLWAFDLAERREFESSVGNVAVARDFNTYDFADTGPDDEFERLVSMYETIHAKGFQQLEARWPPDRDTRSRLSHFVAFQFVRSTRWRELSIAMQETELKEQLRRQAVAAKADGQARERFREELGTRDEVELDEYLDFAARGEYEIKIAPQEHIREMLEVLGEPDYAAYLMDASWELVHAAAGAEFLISDHPVALWKPGRLPLMMAGADQVRVPLDRHRLLVIRADLMREGKRRVADADEVEEFNWVAGLQAKRYLIGHPRWRRLNGGSLGRRIARAQQDLTLEEN